MVFKVNPFTSKLDNIGPRQAGIARYKYAGYTYDSPLVDPGVGYFVFDEDTATGDLRLILNNADLNNSNFVGIVLGMSNWDKGDFILWMHSVQRPMCLSVWALWNIPK